MRLCLREVALPRARLRRSAALFAHARARPCGGGAVVGRFLVGLPRFTAVYPFLDAPNRISDEAL